LPADIRCLSAGCPKEALIHSDGKTRASHCGEHAHKKGKQGTLSPSSKGCIHDGKVVIAEVDGITLRGAQVKTLAKSVASDTQNLIVNCTGKPLMPIVVQPARMNLDTERADELCLAISDFHAPRLGPGFWFQLVAECHRLAINEITPCCDGGHGRTGTVLACLLIALSYNAGIRLSAKKAIEEVRARHCTHAIESAEQREYIDKVAKFAADKPILN
jgi:hypothetical protein